MPLAGTQTHGHPTSGIWEMQSRCVLRSWRRPRILSSGWQSLPHAPPTFSYQGERETSVENGRNEAPRTEGSSRTAWDECTEGTRDKLTSSWTNWKAQKCSWRTEETESHPDFHKDEETGIEEASVSNIRKESIGHEEPACGPD